MNDRLLDECYSCIIASLALIKSLASHESADTSNLLEVSSELAQACVACIRSHEAGSVLPETVERLAVDGQKLVDAVAKSSVQSSEASACSDACENFIRSYNQTVK